MAMAPDESAAAVGSSMKSTPRYAGIVVAAFADPHTVVHGHGDTVEGGTRPVAGTTRAADDLFRRPAFLKAADHFGA